MLDGDVVELEQLVQAEVAMLLRASIVSRKYIHEA